MNFGCGITVCLVPILLHVFKCTEGACDYGDHDCEKAVSFSNRAKVL